MTNLLSVGITNGIPTSGTGTVSTIDALMALLPTGLGAHGGLVIEGVASGTAVPISGSVTATATQSGTWTVQPGNTANTTAWKVDGSAVTQPISGSVTATSVQSGTWTVQPGNTANTTAWKVDGSAVTQPVSFASSAFSTVTNFSCGTTTYAAGDVVGAASANAALDLGVLGTSAGIIEILSASLEIDETSVISGETSYRLYLYNVTPPSAINDSSPWTFASGDRASFLGYVDFGTVVALPAAGGTVYVRVDNIGERLKLSGTHLFAYLVTNGPYTPTGRNIVITIHTSAV